MIQRKGYAAAVVIAPIITGTLGFLVGGAANRTIEPLNLATIPKFIIACLAIALVSRVCEYLALKFMARALGDRSDIQMPSVRSMQGFQNRKNSSELERALYDASALPTGVSSGMAMISTIFNPVSPEFLQIALPVYVLMGILVLSGCYAIMASGWKRCKELLDTEQS